MLSLYALPSHIKDQRI